MSHRKLLSEGKITRREYEQLEYDKTHDPTMYRLSEAAYKKRAKGSAEFYQRRYENLSGHVERAERTQ